MSRICFVTSEIAPTTWGGCGSLLFHAARFLLERQHEVIFVLDLPVDYFDRFQNQDRFLLPHPEHCRAYHVDSIVAGSDPGQHLFASPDAWRSYRYHLACSYVARMERPDIIEFHDFLGIGHYALTMKVAGIDHLNSHIVVRTHNSVEVMDILGPDHSISACDHFVYDLERSALQLAETVLCPSFEYLDLAYRPFYPAWFGNVQESQPPLSPPFCRSGESNNADIVLFYGRVFSIKGVDIFVNAAVQMLSSCCNVRFFIVGYDSRHSPDGSPTYEQFLRKQIPQHLQSFFTFTGQITHKELEEMIPRVRFAVFPNIYESFCYAAHELYSAGVPLIVSDIPAFRPFFRHEENALVFDGTVGDLVNNMVRLWNDPDLRRRLSLPYRVLDRPLGNIYERPPQGSWISSVSSSREEFSLLIGIIGSSDDQFRITLDSLNYSDLCNVKVICLRSSLSCCNTHDAGQAWMLGRLFCLTLPDGSALFPTQVYTAHALLLVQAGDRLSPRFIQLACDILARQKQIGFVGSWRRLHSQETEKIDTFPFDASPELLPFLSQVTPQRFAVRTVPGKLLIDLFDIKTGVLGEIAYIWRLDAQGMRGLIIPEILVDCHVEQAFVPDRAALNALLLRDQSYWHQSRLARLHMWLDDYTKSLSLPNPFAPSTTVSVQKAETNLQKVILDVLLRYPFLKTVARAAYSFFRQLTVESN